MPTVKIDELTLDHKGSGGITMASIPDVWPLRPPRPARRSPSPIRTSPCRATSCKGRPRSPQTAARCAPFRARSS